MKLDGLQLSEETKRELRTIIADKIAEHHAAIDRLKNDLKILDGDVTLQLPSKSNGGQKKKWTFREGLLHILEDGVPKTSREMLTAFNQLADKNLSMGAFSAQLSPLATEGSEIKKDTIPEFPYDYRVFYGLESWFDGNKLKPSYRAKIKNPQRG